MTVGSVAASNGVWSPQPLVPSTPPPADEAADALGLSATDLRDALQSDGVLSSLVSQQRFSNSSLISRIEADLEATAPRHEPVQGAPEPTQVVPGAANPAAPVGAPIDQGAIFLSGPTGVRAEGNLATLADTLGTDPASLLAQLGSGRTLNSLRTASGDAGYGTSNLSSNASGILVDQYA